MLFGARGIDDTDALDGATLAHSLQLADGKRLRKGHVLSGADLDALRATGIDEVIVAIREEADLSEDEAAARIADAIPLEGVRRVDVGTGRVNFHALADGVFTVSAGSVDAMNRVDAAVTIATLPNHSVVETGQMVATVKIIPFFVAGDIVDAAVACVNGSGTISAHPYRDGRKVAVIQTKVPGTKDSVLDKTLRITQERLDAVHAVLSGEARVAHEEEPLSAEIEKAASQADIVLVFGASAVTDPRDVIPQAIRHAGGTVAHVGMPVDPGNLLVLGELAGKPVIGAPGCARSPKENGFDWVMQRLCADIQVTSDDIFSMGVGGLLTEIPVRPHPREKRRARP